MAIVVPLYSTMTDDKKGNVFFLHKFIASGDAEDAFATASGLTTAWAFDANRYRGSSDKTAAVSCASNAPSDQSVTVNLNSYLAGHEIYVITRHREKLR